MSSIPPKGCSALTNYQIETTIGGVFTPRPKLYLAGHEIHLAYDGSETYSGRDILALDDKLIVQFIGPGMSGQEWEIDLVVTPQASDGTYPAKDSKKWSAPGEIPAGGNSALYAEVAVPILEKGNS
jgi:hypothetical protein